MEESRLDSHFNFRFTALAHSSAVAHPSALADLGREDALAEATTVAREAIGSIVGELASCILGRPRPGDADFPDRKAAEGQLPAAERRALLRDWHLTKMRLSRDLGLDPTGDVLNARDLGASWQAIGDAAGVTRQAAHDRWGAAARDYAGGCDQTAAPATPARDWKFVRTRDLEHWQVGYDNPETHRWTAVSEHTSCEAARAELYARLLVQKPTRADREAWLQRFDLKHHELVDVAAALGHPDTAELDRRQLTELILTAAAATTALA